jgi:hypothetical protein
MCVQDIEKEKLASINVSAFYNATTCTPEGLEPFEG